MTAPTFTPPDLPERPCAKCRKPTTAVLCEGCFERGRLAADASRDLEAFLKAIPENYRGAKLDPAKDGASVLRDRLHERLRTPEMLAEARVCAALHHVTILGPSGAGKTHLAVAMLRERYDTQLVIPRFLGSWELAGGKKAAITEEMLRAPLVLLDALGEERLTKTSLVAEFIQRREHAGLPLWITSSLNALDAVKRYGVPSARRVVDYARVIDLYEAGGWDTACAPAMVDREAPR